MNFDLDIRIKIDLPEDIAEKAGINDESILESYYENGYLYIRNVLDEELDELSRCSYGDCDNCDNCINNKYRTF